MGSEYMREELFGRRAISVIFELQRRNFCTIIASECTSSIFLPFFDKYFQSAFFRPTGILSPWDPKETKFRENYEKFLRRDFLNACFRAKTPKKYLKYISVRAFLRSLRAVAQKLRKWPVARKSV